MAKETPRAKRIRKVPAARTAQRESPQPPETPAAGPNAAGPNAEPPRDSVDSVRLPQTLDLAAAAPLALELLSHRGKPTVVDALGVERPGASCLQVLLSAIRTWQGDSVPLTFANCGPPFIEHLRFLGIEPSAFLNGAQS